MTKHLPKCFLFALKFIQKVSESLGHFAFPCMDAKGLCMAPVGLIRLIAHGTLKRGHKTTREPFFLLLLLPLHQDW